MQTHKRCYCEYMFSLYTAKSKFSIGYFLPYGKSAECKHYLMKLDKFVPFDRPPAGQVMTKFAISKTKYEDNNT